MPKRRPLSALALALSVVAAAALVWPISGVEGSPVGRTASDHGAQAAAAGFSPWWVATHAPTDLWREPEGNALKIETLPVGTPLQVLAPQEHARLLVRNALTNNVGWVDALAVGPIPPLQDEELAALLAMPPAFEPWWAMTHMPTPRWSGVGEDDEVWGNIPQWRYLEVIEPQIFDLVLTRDPRTNAYGFVEATALGPVGPPPEEYFLPPPPDDEVLAVPARIIREADTSERPSPADHFSLERLPHNWALTVEGALDRAQGGRWYRIGPAEYVPAARVRLPAPPVRTWPGRWIDADLREPAMVTAYEGDLPVYAALAVKGTRVFQTPTGIYRIVRRVENEIMDSETIGIPRNSLNGYYLKDVLYTQYFTNDGAALHYNYWRSDFGYAGSKGCLGMNLEDSKFFWNFATVGTIVYVH